MVFYIFPPSGRLSLSNIESYLLKRMTLAVKMSTCEGNFHAIRDMLEEVSVVTNSECLIEGSRKDQISHFLLRLACAVNPEMSNFFLKFESSLFMYRLSCMTEPEINSVVQPLKKLHRKLQAQFSGYLPGVKVSAEMCDIFDLLQSITAAHSWESVVSAYINGVGECIPVPFHCVLDLVSHRLVIVKRGVAAVPCSKLPELLKSLFSLLLRHGLRLAREQVEGVKEDIRIWSLFKKIQVIFRQSYGTATPEGMGCLRSEDVDQMAESFPLCMSTLHRTLRTRHRLRHNARIQYTLFLKEIGLPLHEAIDFWRGEYSVPVHADRDIEKACVHQWDRDCRRYTYSIRHLYGLEGRRVNYKGHCCSSLQLSTRAPLDQGGCPFMNTNETSLQNLLTLEGLKTNAQMRICDLVVQGDVSGACGLYMLAKLRSNVPNYHQDRKTQNQYGANQHDPLTLKKDERLSGIHDGNHKLDSQVKYNGEVTPNAYCYKENMELTENADSYHKEREVISNTNCYKVNMEVTAHSRIYQEDREASLNRNSCKEDREVTDNTVSHQGNTEITPYTNCCHEKREITPSTNCYKENRDITPSQNCYQHDACPSSQSHMVTKGDNIPIQKPLHYFLSYQKLKSGLSCVCSSV